MNKRLTLMVLAALAWSGCEDPDAPAYEAGSLSPERWDPEAWSVAWRTYDAWSEPDRAVSSRAGLVVDASSAPSAMAGAAALEAGGNALDAALTAAFTTVAVSMGAPVSLAGVAALVYYDAASGTTHALDGGWALPGGEAELSSIPTDEPSGRAILVPGFMALAQAAHDRFGRLPFPALFEPAIHVADRGFTLTEDLARSIEMNGEVLGRRPETRSVFTGGDGGWLQAGDTFTQPELARTLRRLAAEGADHMYRGEWAEALVAAVREEGGHLTMDDLASYEAVWSEAAVADYGDYEIHVPGGENAGGTALIEALRLLDRAGVADSGPVFESPESLYWISRIGYLLWVADFRRGDFEEAFPEISTDLEARRSPAHASALWDLLQTEAWDEFVAADPYSQPVPDPPAHTDAIVTVDRWGNAAALIFSSNVVWWGRTGVFVEGVSVPDAGRATSRLAGLQPGDRVPNQLNPILALQDGEFATGMAALGAGIHHASVQTLLNVLDFGMDPLQATTTPQVAHFAWPGAPGVPPGTPVATHLVEEGRFPEALLDSVRALGQPILEIPAGAAYNLLGRVSLIVADSAGTGLTGIGSTGGLAVPAAAERDR